jgi:hypothetical protein
MSWVWEHSRAEGTARLVLLAIADHAGHDGRDAYPSQEKIAAKCKVSVRTVRRALDELESLGELGVERYKGRAAAGASGGRPTHRYSLPGYADSLAGNSGDVDEVTGQLDEVTGQLASSNRTQVSGEPSEPSFDPSRRVASEKDVIACRLYQVLHRRNRRVRLGECKNVVAVARAANIADHIIDEAVGRAEKKADVLWPSWVEKALAKQVAA